MKKEKITAVLFYFASVFFYVAAIVGFIRGNSMAIVWLCLGSAMLCLGSICLNKLGKSPKNEKENGKGKNEGNAVLRIIGGKNNEKD